MIRDFADDETERVWDGRGSRVLPPDIQQPHDTSSVSLTSSKGLTNFAFHEVIDWNS